MHFKTSDGLASTTINNVVQDYKGYIWLSTINGLQRYDGNKFITFSSDSNHPSALPSNNITGIYEDRKRNLWVLTNDNKVGIFNTVTFTYTEVPVKQGARQRIYIKKVVFETADGQLWLLIQADRLYRYDASTTAFVTQGPGIPLPENWKPNGIFQDKVTQKYWIATDSGLAVFNPKTRALSYGGNNREHEPAIRWYAHEQFINYVFVDAKKRLFLEQWIKSRDHPVLHMFDLAANQTNRYDLRERYGLGYYEIKALLNQRNGNVWVYGLPYVAQYIDRDDAFAFIRKEDSEQGITFNDVYSLYEDRQLNIWICTDNGVYVFNPDVRLFDNYTLVRPNGLPVAALVQTALQLTNHDIWVGSRDLGLFCYDDQFNPLPVPAGIAPFQQKQSVWDIHQHSKTGVVWVALQGGKLITYHPITKRSALLAPPALEHRAITQITEDYAGNLWFGTQAGNIVKWNYTGTGNEAEQNFTLIKKTGMVHKLFTDNKGYIWAATVGDGLLKIDPVRNTVTGNISADGAAGYRLWNNTPSDIIQYNDSLLMVAGDALNLINLNTNRVQYISTLNGLPSNNVVSLVKDAKGVLWLGMVNGLCRANLEKKSFTMYYRNDGILNDNFNIGGAHVLLNGRLLFTSKQHFVTFSPFTPQHADTLKDAHITDFRLSDISLSVDSLSNLERINLPYNKNSITIEFSALNYYLQNKLSYYYQLEGFNKEWISSDDRHQAIYSYLPPGNYTFKVKTKNADGVFSNRITALSIRIHPPFWRTWWFYSLVALSVISIMYIIDKERVKRLNALHYVRSEIASKLYTDVSTTLNNVNILSHIAKLKASSGDIEKSKEFIDQIEEKSNSMAIAMDDMLWSIDPGNDSLEKTLLRIVEFAQMLEASHQAVIDIRLDHKVKQLELDMKIRYEFLMICKEAFQSLVEMTNGKNLLVNIDLVRSKVFLKIQSDAADDISKEKIFRLKNKMDQRAEALHAQLEFVTSKKETSIILEVPL